MTVCVCVCAVVRRTEALPIVDAMVKRFPLALARTCLPHFLCATADVVPPAQLVSGPSVCVCVNVCVDICMCTCMHACANTQSDGMGPGMCVCQSRFMITPNWM